MTDAARRRRILFVDDEERILQGIQRQLRSMRNEWDIRVASSADEGLRQLAIEPCDVVVSDMRMPGMDGAQFLQQVMERWPHTVRIILSGQADRESILRSLAATHQYLAKPCDPDRLRAVVGRACALRDILYDQELQRLVASMETVPSLPGLYQQIQDELSSPEPSVKRIGDIVSMDLGMSAKLLQLVNSARFGLSRQVSSPGEAVSLLGVSTVRSLVLSSHVFTELDQLDVPGLSAAWLWQHALAVGSLARAIARAEKQTQEQIDLAFTAGLLHDCGMLLLLANRRDEYAVTITTGAEIDDLCAAEQADFGADHAAIGAYLLGLWALPEPIVEAVAFHHRPSAANVRTLGPLAIVHVAARLVDEDASAGGQRLSGLGESCDEAFIETLGFSARLPAWRELRVTTKGDER